MENNQLRQRIKARLADLKIGATEAATAVRGLERNFIRDFLEGKKNSFSTGKQAMVAEALRWSVDELIGAPPKRTDRAAPKIALVPLLDTVTAGKLASPSSQIPVEEVPLLAFADLGRGEFFALRVEGDSMDRISPEGSTIVVNRLDKTLIGGRSYVFAERGQTTFKRWQPGQPGFTPYLEPYSTNEAHKPIFFKKRDLEVIGRVKRTVLDL
jgi:SOS-response transcriptional repressor LexA